MKRVCCVAALFAMLELASCTMPCAGCKGVQKEAKMRTFGGDVEFLGKHLDVIVLKDQSGQAQVVLVPEYQGRVMTSTAGGVDGYSAGWINYDLISSGTFVPHIHVFGGEDRFWLGPEGGQFAIFFPKGAREFTLANWQTPAFIDTDPFEVVRKSDTEAVFRKDAKLVNVSGTEFQVGVTRTIRLLSRRDAEKKLDVQVPESVKMVAYESDNTLKNVGEDAWTKDGGLLSIWILGMYKHSPDTTVVIPFKEGAEAELGPKVNDSYFGKVPDDRLVVRDDVLYFKADGDFRSKIGISPKRSKPVLGSYNESEKLLTLVQYTLPEGAVDYVNSMWKLQDEPFAGDVVNSYNDGPPEPGKKPLGPFYELETSSPAAALKPGESVSHVHRTIHLQGSEEALDTICRAALGVGLAEVKGAF